MFCHTVSASCVLALAGCPARILLSEGRMRGIYPRVGARSQIPSHLTGIIKTTKASSLEPSTSTGQDRPPITVLTCVLAFLSPSD